MSTTFPNGPRTESFMLSSTNYSHRNRPYEITQLNHRIQIDYIPRSLSFFKLHNILTDSLTHTHTPATCLPPKLSETCRPSMLSRGSRLARLFQPAACRFTTNSSSLRSEGFLVIWNDGDPVFTGCE